MTATYSNPNLVFERRGPALYCSYKDPSEWPLVLIARDVYYGTGRLLATLTLIRDDGVGKRALNILTESVDMLTATQRKRFATEAATRIANSQGEDHSKFSPSILTMVDAVLEQLTAARGEVVEVDLFDVPLPADLSPRYAVWPIVPVARPGMLVAPSGAGKSTLAAAIALSVSHELEIIPGIEPRITGPVIYIGQEEDVEQMRVRVELIARGRQIQLLQQRLIYQRLPGGTLIDSAERIAERVAIRRAVLIIVDSAQATWGDDSEAIRSYATRWFSAVAMLGAPALIIEHPSKVSTMKPGQFLEAAGTTVKRDRAGHVWTVNSTELPQREGHPHKYHVTLKDSKRNYVARQPDIIFENISNGYQWMQFHPASPLSSEQVVDESRTWAATAAVTRPDDKQAEEDQHPDGWTVAEIQARLHHKDDRRIRHELTLDMWRPHPTNTHLLEKTVQVEGTGTGRDNPARFKLVSKERDDSDAVQLSMPPGGGDEVS